MMPAERKDQMPKKEIPGWKRMRAAAFVLVLLLLWAAPAAAIDRAPSTLSPAVPAPSAAVPGQFLPADLREQGKWEEFLRTADITASEQRTGRGAVTKPWVLTLEQGGVSRRAVWKNPSGLMAGYWEGWQYEIAAYLLDKHLGIGMVPPTVERRFKGDKGSCQLWIEDCLALEQKQKKNLKVPPARIGAYNRAVYLQRFFDNLIANEDRHANQILITNDWRMLLIDHSRSFRTAPRFTTRLIFSEKNPDGPKLMNELPRSVVDKVKILTFESLKEITAGHLDGKEIQAILARRDLILKDIDKLIKMKGEARVLY